MRFHSLSFLDDGDEVIVGRPDVDVYAVFPRDGAALLRELQAGRPPTDAAAWYEATFRERVDVDDLLATLEDLRFLRSDEDDGADFSQPPEQSVRWRWLGRALFSPPAWFCYAALVAAAVAVCLFDPNLVPRRQNVFFVHSLVAVELTIILGQLLLTLLHEEFHVLAARRLGVHARVRLGHRLYFVVFETVLDGLVAVPRARRYLPILAGLVADVVVVASLTLAAAAARRVGGDGALVGGVFLALAFTTLPRIAWQFYFFLRTDIYYLITTALGCIDLHTTAREMLSNRLNRLLGRVHRLHDETRWHARDREAARWYAPLVIVGYATSVIVLLAVLLPVGLQFLTAAVVRALGMTGSRPVERWDAVAFLGFTVLQLLLALALTVRDRRDRRSLGKTRISMEATP